MKKTWVCLLLILITLFGFSLRFYQFTKTPIGFNWDEASVGYNAYSLLETGRDEFGRSWPLFIESFGDFKTGLYSILLVPIINQFGLSVFTVRILNVFIGTSLIVAAYYLGKQFFQRASWGLVLAGLTAISPLAIHLSRFTLEWYAALPIFVTAIGLLLSKDKITWQLPIAAVLFGFSLYWYHSFRLFLPLFLMVYLFIYRQQLWQKKKLVILSFILGLLSILPLIKAMQKFKILSRPQAVAIFSSDVQQRAQTEGLYRFTVAGWPLRRIFTNKGTYYFQEILARYLGHFSPDFLFFGEDATPRISIHPIGKLQWVALPFLLLGLVSLIKQGRRRDWLLLAWLLLAPLPASLTNDAPHGLRSLLLLPALWLLIVMGLKVSYQWVKEKWPSWVVWLSVSFVGLAFVGNFFLQYTHYLLFYSEATAQYWQADQQALVKKINQYQADYEQVLVTTYAGQPHIFLAFFTPLEPTKFQTAIQDQAEIFNSRIAQLGKFKFESIEPEDYCQAKTLIVTTDPPRVKNLKPLDTVSLPNRWHEPKTSYYLYDVSDPLIQTKLCLTK